MAPSYSYTTTSRSVAPPTLLLLLLLLLLLVPSIIIIRPCSSYSTGAPISVPVTVAPDGRGYLINVTMGRAPSVKPATLFLDTGTDYTWVACDPNHARTAGPHASIPCDFQRVSCHSPLCDSLKSSYGKQCNPDDCVLSMQYGDGTSLFSYLAIDVLNLGGGGGNGSTRIAAFAFGAATVVSSASMDGYFDGLLGLGRGPLGLATATEPDFGGVFSYCLPSATSNKQGFLQLGGDGYYAGRKGCVRLSTIWPRLDPAFYVLDVMSVTVGNTSHVPRRPIIVDSGTVFSSLDLPSYAAIHDAVRSSLDHAFPQAPPDPSNGLYTCYYYYYSNGRPIIDSSFFDNANVTVPRVVFQFADGVSYGPLTIEQMFFQEASTNSTGSGSGSGSGSAKFCLAFSGTNAPFSVLGSFQQQRNLFIFDAVKSAVCIDQSRNLC